MARALAYYMCEKNLTADASFNEDPVVDSKDINKFIDANPKCEFIQVHPSMDYNDVVYGMDIKADGCLSLSFTEKRILKLCDKARGQSGKYCVILDDINRTDSGMLLGNLLYAMEYRDQDVDMPDGSKASIPDNVIMIFTENTMDAGKGLDLAVRRRMTYLRELKSSRDNLQKYYYGFISNTALKLVLDSYDRIADYIKTYVDDEIGLIPSNFIPGHGMFMVPRFGNTHYILDNIRQKIRLQVAPYLKDLYSRGMLKIDPEPFLEQILQSINVGIAGVSPISAIKKKLVRQNLDVTTFSLADSRDYYKNTIVPGGSSDSRGMMECILDAMILNGVFPYDVLLGSLLQNTNIAYVETLHAPVDKAAYIVEKYKANRFQYQTVRKKNGKTVVSGTHAYFTLDNAATGRWASQQDTEEYVASFNDGRQDVELIPLSGFRNHGFDPNSPEIAVITNILPDCPDTYTNYEEYIDCQKNIFKFQDENGKVVLNYDNDVTRYFSSEAPGKARFFSGKTRLDNGVIYDNKVIKSCVDGVRMHIMTIDDAISIHGMHNYENICAAIAATEDLADPYSQLRAITKFKGIEKEEKEQPAESSESAEPIEQSGETESIKETEQEPEK